MLAAAIGSGLEVAVDEVDLLQPPQALANLLRADLPDALDALELTAGGGEHHVEGAELVDDVLNDRLRKAWNPAEDTVATRGDREVERVQLPVVAEELS